MVLDGLPKFIVSFARPAEDNIVGAEFDCQGEFFTAGNIET